MNMPSSIVTPKTSSPPATQSEPELILRLGCYAAIGLFVFALLAVLQIAASIVTPIISALVVETVLARVSDRLMRLGLSSVVAGFCVIGFALATGALMINALIEPFSALVARAPQMAEALTTLISPALQPLSNLRNALLHTPGAAASLPIGGESEWLASFVGGLTPALGQLLIFFASLAFFVSGRTALRRQLVMAMPERASRLTAIRAIAAVENALSLYFGTTTLIYAAVGALTAIVAWASGLTNPLLWGAMSFAAAYIPYFGVGLISLSLAASGFLAYPHSLLALAPATAYLVIHIASETFVIPTLLGRRYEVNPFLIFLSIVFWSWMWGPVGAILAAPLLLSAQTLLGLFREPEGYLP
ncbi:hypothetical protein CCR94_15670 [Rhodoblastus sphagnicola]|uniref:AI-2E family transporter n=1 Tax=Rhodoblastus sphagnicola TaxID=333368 RepID=A0A2S6N3Q8_9HYPH|nr:AI-2E family transporter [Rhodoblastus sphagnicola]MBB4198952.1 putative PurR-regulated permease PerM [Rhodoblastus sphagnicola]PPQ29250.1 hypothetical protein CCR94_15670 [Rhodoblastus sphagnicola]